MIAAILAHEPFWRRLAAAPACFLGLDYDGTLAPFRVDRLAAVPLDGVVPALEQLRALEDCALAVISGRRLDEVLQLLGRAVDGITVVGSHGHELRTAAGERRDRPLGPAQAARLEQAGAAVERLGMGQRLERKAASVAFHTRGEPSARADELEARVEQLWQPLAAGAALSCARFNGGVELRARGGVDKGTVLAGLLDQQRPGTLAVYVGDDATDEDAFEVLRRRGGVGVKVGGGDSASAADLGLPDCPGVLRFLRRFARVRAGPGGQP